MAWQLWLIPLVIFWSFGFRRRWHKRQRGEEGVAVRDPEMAGELEAQRHYIGDLEVRIAELENRLDFTERLLSTRAQVTSR